MKHLALSAGVLAGLASAQIYMSPSAYWDVNTSNTVTVQAGRSATVRLAVPLSSWKLAEDDFDQIVSLNWSQRDSNGRLLATQAATVQFELASPSAQPGLNLRMYDTWLVRQGRVLETGQAAQTGEKVVSRRVDGRDSVSRSVAYQTRLIATFTIHAPANLAPGQYTVQIPIRNRYGDGVATLPVTVNVSGN